MIAARLGARDGSLTRCARNLDGWMELDLELSPSPLRAFQSSTAQHVYVTPLRGE